MPLPAHPGHNGYVKYCAPFLKEGAWCRYKGQCKMDHTKLDDMSLECKKLWCDLVRETKDMSFNKKRVKSAVFFLDEKPAANADKK